ncbi:MAG: acetyl-CoA C-acetyltransferase, partial [Candidatus Puniceispirillaceae bacterium]
MSDPANPSDIVIAGAARTPMGGFQGDLTAMTAPQLGGAAISAALADCGAETAAVDEVLMGCVLPAGVGQAPARQAGFAAALRCAPGGCRTVLFGGSYGGM